MTNTKRIALAILAVATLAAPGCGKKDSGSGSAAGGTAATKPAGDEAKAGPTKLAKLDNLTIDAADAEVSDAIGGDGVMLTSGAFGALTISVQKTPQSIDDAKSDANMYTPKNLKADKLADGYVVTYDNTGSMGANFFVQVRRDLGGKTYSCSTTVSTADQQTAAVAACKSLKK
jgi:hypothetical protein